MNGHLHPLTQFMRLSLKFFEERGFEIVEGPEVETDWNNFDALNMLENHPARDTQDTFWLASSGVEKLVPPVPSMAEGSNVEGIKNEKKVLRTHTTAVEPEFVKINNLKPPFKLIIPGRCFRHEPTDMTHEHTFYQIDGIAVGKNMNMGYLMGILDEYMKVLFGKDVKSRFRPHYYPFVEPGMDMDIQLPNGKWQEMLGSGMGHPQVLKNMGIDPEKWQAIMWGMGIDRYMMQYFGIDDIRLSYSGDLRFLKQF